MDSKLQKNSLWLDLLNSDWHDFRGGGKHEDRLFNDVWLKNFLLPWQGSLKATPLPKIQAKLKDLRCLLRRMAEDFSKQKPLGKMDLERLNDVLGNSPEIKKVVPSGRSYALKHEMKTSGIHSILAELAHSFAEILAFGEPERIKICRNPDCLWIFYDNSKNHSRKWCENATGCGNMMKVRMFRAKTKQKI
jgi:predicted RNA-binding Zn ribbon-like protein